MNFVHKKEYSMGMGLTYTLEFVHHTRYSMGMGLTHIEFCIVQNCISISPILILALYYIPIVLILITRFHILILYYAYQTTPPCLKLTHTYIHTYIVLDCHTVMLDRPFELLYSNNHTHAYFIKIHVTLWVVISCVTEIWPQATIKSFYQL